MNADFLIGIVSVLLGGYWGLEGMRLGWWERVSPGPGFLPVFVGVGMVAVGLVLAWQSRRKTAAPMTGLEKKWLIQLPLFAVLVLVFMEFIGAMLSLSLFLLGWFLYIERFSRLKAVKLAFVIMLAINLIFVQWLDVPFPKLFGVI